MSKASDSLFIAYFYEYSLFVRLMSVNIYHTENLPVPVKIIVERRSSARVSLGKNAVIVRLPKHISMREKEITVQKFLVWAKQQIREKKYYAFEQNPIEFYHEKEIKIWDTTFKIDIEYFTTGRNKLSFRGSEILKIYLLASLSESEKKMEIQRLLLRFTERYFLKAIQQRTLFWNDQYFKEQIEKIDLKHTISRWGSCSSNRKISFSTKLLLLPESVIDYVIVHELAHLKEMNHSARFWKHVERAMPDYKSHQKWLQQHGNSVDF